jgi:lambda family phage minor tail protein L
MTAPTLSSSTPATGAKDVATNSNLVLVFSEAVDRETGNIEIYKYADDSIVETIDVTSGQVTGTGTTTITVNPSSDLLASTQYYILIDATAFDNAGGESYAGIESKTNTDDALAYTFTTAAVPNSVQEQIQLLEPSAVIELFQLHLTASVNGVDAVYYYHAGTNEIYGNIIFNSITYSAVPCQMDGFERTTTGTLPRPTFTIANANSAISILLASYNPLNAKIVRITTFKKFLDAVNFTSGTNSTADPTAIAEGDDTWYIDRIASENMNAVQFELSTKMDLINVRLPRRQVLEHCPWVFKGTECTYAGADATCGHKYSDCAEKFPGNTDLPFGGFPSARLQM